MSEERDEDRYLREYQSRQVPRLSQGPQIDWIIPTCNGISLRFRGAVLYIFKPFFPKGGMLMCVIGVEGGKRIICRLRNRTSF